MRRSRRWLVSSLALLPPLGAGLFVLSRLLPPAPPPARVDWAEALLGISDDGFAPPSGEWRLDLPADHGAHPGARTETWTVSAHLRSRRGEDIALQLALLRLALVAPDAQEGGSAWAPRELYRGHVTLLIGGAGRAIGEERFNRAVLGLAGHDGGRRRVWLDNWSIGYGEDGDALRLDAGVGEVSVELRLTPSKGAVASGAGGAGAPFRGFAMTRMSVEGFVDAEGDRQAVAGLAWLDHLWGDVPLPVGPIAWDRLQLHLDDGTDVAVFRSRRRDGRGTPTLDGLTVDARGVPERLADGALAMEPTRTWRRDGAGAAYPLGWRVRAGELDLHVAPSADDQLHEFSTPIWSGAVTARGELRGREVAGLGTLQLTGYDGR